MTELHCDRKGPGTQLICNSFTLSVENYITLLFGVEYLTLSLNILAAERRSVLDLTGIDKMTFPLSDHLLTGGVANKKPLALVISVSHNLSRNEHRNKGSL